MTCGIYCLYYETDDFQYYIGESLDIEGRYKRHCSALQSYKHKNYKLLSRFKIFGKPTLAIIEITTPETIKAREIHWISVFNSFHDGMNLTIGGDGCSFGENHPRAVYTDNIYISILLELANTDYNFTEIAKRLSVDASIVTNIAHGHSHAYLAKEYPIEYALMLSKKGSRHVGGVLTEDKQIYISILNDLAYTNTTMKVIADTYGVNISIVMDISKGKSHKHLKNICPDAYLALESKRGIQGRFTKVWPKVVSPEGVVCIIENSALFARENDLDTGGLSRVLNGKQNSIKGWKVYNEQQ